MPIPTPQSFARLALTTEEPGVKLMKEALNHSLGPVVRTPVSANPGLNFNQGFFFLSSKELSRMVFYIFLQYPIIKL